MSVQYNKFKPQVPLHPRPVSLAMPLTTTSSITSANNMFENKKSNIIKKEKKTNKATKAKKGDDIKEKSSKPKKAMTPFMVFSKETRRVLVNSHPGLTFSEIGKELGARWRALSDNERQEFVIKANEDYQRFLQESEGLEDGSKKRKTQEQRRQTKAKKAISAYLYFCNAHRPQVKAMHPEMKMVEIQKLLAERWTKSSQSVKMPFEKQAAADRIRYNSDLKSLDADEGDFIDGDEDDTAEDQHFTANPAAKRLKREAELEVFADEMDDSDDSADDPELKELFSKVQRADEDDMLDGFYDTDEHEQEENESKINFDAFDGKKKAGKQKRQADKKQIAVDPALLKEGIEDIFGVNGS